MGTIAAVLMVFVFLVSVVAPLFTSASVNSKTPQNAQWIDQAGDDVIHMEVDDYGILGWFLQRDGAFHVFDVRTGRRLGERHTPFGEARLSAWSINAEANHACFGFEDGTVRLGTLGVEIAFLGASQVPEQVRAMAIGESIEIDDTLFVHTQPGQFRRHVFGVRLQAPLKLGEAPIELVGHTIRNVGPLVVVLAGGQMTVNSVHEIRHFLSGEVTYDVHRVDMPYDQSAERGAPEHLLVSKLGDMVYVAWSDGRLRRYDTRALNDVRLAEAVDLFEGQDARLTTFRFLIGRTTLVAGNSLGELTAWFCVPDETALDGARLTPVHRLGAGGAAVTALANSARSRLLVAGYADGVVRLFHVTTANILAEVRDAASDGVPVRAVAFGARETHLMALLGTRIHTWSVDRKHPEITARSLFLPVWYEGFSEPRHMWQSSAAVDDFEPKYGMMPLIFGTLKATFYSLLFGLPLALLAAIYTSEFLHPRLKMKIKPTIEMMASLPSVVLGFISALVVAPAVENSVAEMLSCFITIPVTYLISAHLWQMLPRAIALRLAGWRRHAFMMLALPLGVALGVALGPWVERQLFAGDIKRWLDGQIGSGTGGWLFLLLPLTAIVTASLTTQFVAPRLRLKAAEWTRFRCAAAEFWRFAATVCVALFAAWALGWGLSELGFDPRGNRLYDFMGTYVQRNALIVGFIMGFAIIPIIYTIAEDALSAVPEHLRSASLGCGATPWQTAIRVIIPTAMSGLFSAAMIGLGRAAGETMIVLMAAGNTPVIQMNLFNGFRTLSANIAVEMPEAPIGSSHYRVLFLAALTLFVLTFVVNTLAEVVRQRFRRRAFKL